MFKWLLKKKLDKAGYPWIEISPLCLIDYRYRVKGNDKEDTYILEKKLNRNYYLGTFDSEKETESLIYKHFGALTIIYNKKLNTIIGITNHKGKEYSCNVDKDEKKKLNKIYGLK